MPAKPAETKGNVAEESIRLGSAGGSAIGIGVLASGKGSNLRNLLERGYRVVAVATNRPSCGAAAIARERGVELGEFPQSRYASREERDLAMLAWLRGRDVELVVNAGYDRILSPQFVAAYPGRIVNVHPSLLPAFGGGMDAVEQALAYGVKITGCTVHLVIDEVDAGPILVQAAVPVVEGDTAESLRARIQVQEHRILPEAIDHIATKSPSLRQ
jgi:phosphoribosylglycinamide formyltransferase 1